MRCLRIVLCYVLMYCILFFTSGCKNEVDNNIVFGNYLVFNKGEIFQSILNRNESGISNTNKGVLPSVMKYAGNNEFLVAIQKPSLQGYITELSFDLRENNSELAKDKSGFLKSEKMAAEIIRTSPYYQSQFVNNINYWIVDLRKDIVFGPYNEPQYLKKRRQLNIPETINLKSL